MCNVKAQQSNERHTKAIKALWLREQTAKYPDYNSIG